MQDLAWNGPGVVHLYVSVCVCVLALARESGCPGVVLGICPIQETQARSPGQCSSNDKNAISVCLFLWFHFHLSLFSPVVSEGSVC